MNKLFLEGGGVEIPGLRVNLKGFVSLKAEKFLNKNNFFNKLE